MELCIDGIDIIVEKKKIKNMYLKVKSPDGRVVLSAPQQMDDDTIRMFVKGRIEWIKKQQGKMKYRKEEVLRYETGEEHYLWGKPYTMKVVHIGGCRDVYLQGNQLILNTKKDSTPEEREKQVQNWYRGQLIKVLPGVLSRCEKIVGKSAKECRIKNMKTRWGTCNIVEHRIWINLQLVKRLPECLDYVMIHELTHLYERGHGARFKAYMDRFYPNWREVKRRLNTRI